MNFLRYQIALAAVAAGLMLAWPSVATAGEIALPAFDWTARPFAAINDGICRVEVVPAAAAEQNVVSAVIDLTPYRGKTLMFTIRAKADQVSRPAQVWNGIKFMLYYKDGAGQAHWLQSNNPCGSFDWREISFSASVSADAGSGKLMIGLQDSAGVVQFDLASLRATVVSELVNQDFIINYPVQMRMTPPLRGVMSSQNEMTADDFKTLHDWGANLVRLQICRNWGKADTDLDLDDYDRWLDGRLDQISRELVLAQKYDIRAVIDLHSPPGGRYADNDMRMFYEPRYAEHYIKIWERIAGRFRNHPAVFGYDLINEPIQTRPTTTGYWQLQQQAAAAVRSIDPDTALIVESNDADAPQAFAYLSPFRMDNVIYQVHMYTPGAFTHQGVLKNCPAGPDYRTSVIDAQKWDKEALRRVLAPVRAFQQKHQARIYVGEFSAVAWAPGAPEYLSDLIEIFEEYHWDWTYHAFREWPGWSVEHEGNDIQSMKPAADTPRKQILLRGLHKNQK